LDDYRVELNTNVTPDQRRYNAPTTDQVAAIWMDGDETQRCFHRSVVVFGKTDRRMQYVRAWHGGYDALAYPVYNPNGETGWNKYIPYSDAPITPPSANMTPAIIANPPSTTMPSTSAYEGILCHIYIYRYLIASAMILLL
jgi:hypothetical protein